MSLLKKNGQYVKFFGSSEDPEKLALTIKGILLGLVPVAVAICKAYNLPFVENDFMQFIEVGFGVVAGGLTFWGLIRKFYNYSKT